MEVVCQLCQADAITTRYFDDELCWVAECESCSVPMVVWKQHGAFPDPAAVEQMVQRLDEIARLVFGERPFRIDRVMRQIPDHFHAHARPRPTWLQ